MHVLSIIQFLEKATAFTRGKGQKTQSVLKLLEDIPEVEIERKTASKAEEAPKLVIMLKEGSFETALIKCDTSLIYTRASNVGEALVVLLATYYCFQLSYPRCYSNWCLANHSWERKVPTSSTLSIKSVR